MGIYIQTQGNKVLSIGGTIASQEMLNNGYFEYKGEIPKADLDHILYDQEKNLLYIDDVAYKQRLDSLILEARNKIEILHNDFNKNFFGDISPIEVSSWEFKFRLANSLNKGEDLSEEEETYLQYANIKTKKNKKIWSDKVLNKAIKTRTIQAVADYIRTEGKDKLKASTKHEEIQLIIDAVKIEFSEKLEEFKKLFNK